MTGVRAAFIGSRLRIVYHARADLDAALLDAEEGFIERAVIRAGAAAFALHYALASASGVQAIPFYPLL